MVVSQSLFLINTKQYLTRIVRIGHNLCKMTHAIDEEVNLYVMREPLGEADFDENQEAILEFGRLNLAEVSM